MRVFFSRAFALALTLLLLFPTGNAETWYIRVVARDDTDAARREKMRVAAAALSALPFSGDQMPAFLPRVFLAARRECGDAACSVRLWSPDEKTPPRMTCYIVIGRGGGHNWWGVLFPDAVRLTGEKDTGGDGVCFTFPLFSRLIRLLFHVHPGLQGV